MSEPSSTVGTCPRCGEPLRESVVLIEYETDHGTRRYVECPACGEPVRPA